MRDAIMPPSKKTTKKKLTKKLTKKPKLSPHAQRYRDAMDEYEATLAGTDVLSDHEESLFEASKLNLPKGYLSISQVESYLACPARYEYTYIKPDRFNDKSVALAEGSTHHLVLEDVNQAHINGKTPPSVKKRIEMFGDYLDKEIKDVTDMEGETKDSVMGRGEQIIKQYHNRFEPDFRPTHSEMVFAVPVGDIPVVGSVDAIGSYKKLKQVIVDYKTVKRKKSEKDLLHSLQLNFYGYALWMKSQSEGGTPVSLDTLETGYCNLMKNKGTVEWQSVGVSKARINWTRRVIVSVASAISAGNFPLTSPTSWVCDQRFCGAYGVCRGSCS